MAHVFEKKVMIEKKSKTGPWVTLKEHIGKIEEIT